MQAYLAAQAEAFRCIIDQTPEQLERIIVREELVDGNKSLASTAKMAGVSDYSRFQNAGYLGMYNRTAGKLKELRGGANDLFDTMVRTELAANLFRVTQTEERIKNQSIKGQKALEETHRMVGAEVRRIVQENTGRTPEALPQEDPLPDIKKELKDGYKGMLKQDKTKK